jgi:hypothetical protein
MEETMLTMLMVFAVLLQVHTPADSAAVFQWLSRIGMPVLRWLPEPSRALVVAAVVSFAFAALERIVLFALAKVPALSSLIEAWIQGHVVSGKVDWKRIINAAAVLLLGWWMGGTPWIGAGAAVLRDMFRTPKPATAQVVALVAALLLGAAPGAQAAAATPVAKLTRARVSWLTIAPGAGVRYDRLTADPHWWYGVQAGPNVGPLALRGRIQWDMPKAKPRGSLEVWAPF